MNETRKYLTDKEVSELTGRAIPTLRNDRCRGVGIPYIKLSRQVRYNIDDVVKYMESRKIQTEDSPASCQAAG